jgi:hypothetical protein
MAMSRLVDEPALRQALGRAGRAHWSAHHTLEHMAADYRRVLALAAARPAPAAIDLPKHFLDDHSALARSIGAELGVALDVLPASHA